MTTHQPIPNSERVLLPRSLLGRRHTYVATYRFKVGQPVQFHGESAIIRDRQRSAMGREIYRIEMTVFEDLPLRVVLGTALNPVS